MKDNGSKLIKRILQLSPLIMLIVMAVLYFVSFRNMTVDELLHYTPEEPLIAALVILLMYGLKSLSYFFPFAVIAAACGAILPTVPALIVNFTGIIIMTTIPFSVGRYAEKELVDKLVGKNEKAENIRKLGTDNQLFSSFFLRIINMLPCDVVSMLLGSMGYSFKTYLLGSFLGIAPGIAATTIMGASVTDPTSPEFIISAAVEIVLAVSSLIGYRIYLRKRKQNA
ncbi:MAG: TVP38/TMEM64 family protein [Huintestinicola sp.]